MTELTYEELDELERFCGNDTHRLPKSKKLIRLHALISLARRGLDAGWQDISEAPKCDLNPYDARASQESQYVLVWNGYHIGCAYYQIDEDDEDGGYWVAEDGPFIVPEPTHFQYLPTPPEGA